MKKKILPIMLFITIILLLILVVIYSLLPKKDENKKVKVITTSKKSKWMSPSGTNGLVNIYEYKEPKTLDITNKEKSDSDFNDDYELKYSYKCNNNACIGLDIYEDLGYAVIKDDDYILYNYKKDLYKKLDVNSNDIVYLRLIYFENKIYGYTLTNKDGLTAIYNVKLKKEVTEYKYSSNEYFNYSNTPEVLDNSFIYYEDNDNATKTTYYLIDLETGKEKYTAIVDYENYDDNTFYIRSIGNKNGVYYIKGHGLDGYDDEICDSNFNPIIEGRYSKYSVTTSGNIIVTFNNNTFGIYNNKGKLVKKSKEYKSIIAVGKDFIAVLDNDNYIKVVDYDGKVLASFTEKTDNIIIHDLLSGWYSYDNKDGMYVVLEDESISEGTEGRGLEYYYEPKTKTQGVIKLPEIGGYAKPVLYLYPKNDNTKIEVSFDKENILKTTYPKYNGKWSVIANKNGDLTDLNGKKYYALYWDEETYKKVSFNEEFYVTYENAINFLEEKLDIIGLNYKEKNEFIMYWLPVLESNKQSLVYFEFTKSREEFNKLNINPKPDSLLRFAIHIKKVNGKVNIKSQKLDTFKRSGFTAVEWGGVNY